MLALSREKRKVIELWADYFEMYDPDGFEKFYQSKLYRCYFSTDIYPPFKIDMHEWFKDKDYYPESHLENPMSDGVWYVKPNVGANGKGIIITDDVRSVDMKNAVYQKGIDNPLLQDGRKQDLRMFIAMTTYQGYLRTYLFFDHFVRLAPMKYDENNLSSEVQLTNWDSYWIDFYDDLELRPKYSWDIINNGMISFTQHPHREILEKKFIDMMVDFSDDVYEKLNNQTQRNMIHIFGMDVMPDEDMKLWMLETNDAPHPSVVDDKRTPKIWPEPHKQMNYAETYTKSAIDELVTPMQTNSDVKLDKYTMIYEKKLIFNKWIYL